VNLPVQLTPHLHRQLFEDLEKKQEKDEISKFKNFIIMTKICEKQEKSSKQEKKTKFTPIFLKEEEELYFKQSSLNYHFALKNQYTEDSSFLNLEKNLKVSRLVMVIKRKNIKDILKEMTSIYDDSVPEKKK
jgi:hypothetical protein